MGVEQSNTSVVLDERLVLKLYRRLEAGTNPELELLRFLTERGFANIARSRAGRARGAAAGRDARRSCSSFVRARGDGWELALDDARGRAGVAARARGAARRGDRRDAHGAGVRPGDPVSRRRSRAPSRWRSFGVGRRGDRAGLHRPAGVGRSIRSAAEARRYGTGCGCCRASGRSGASSATTATTTSARCSGARRRLDRARLRGRAGAVAAGAAAQALAAPGRRGHAAVVRLRVAGGADPARRRRPDGWEERCRQAFLDAYISAVDRVDPAAGENGIARLLSVFELEKAVYELRYELNNRPDWVRFPSAGILRILESEL